MAKQLKRIKLYRKSKKEGWEAFLTRTELVKGNKQIAFGQMTCNWIGGSVYKV